MLRQATYFLAFVVLMVAGFLFIERAFSPVFQSCTEENEGHNTGAAAKDDPSAGVAVIRNYIRCSGAFADRHGGGIAALASIVIAAFTFTLWIATSQQARLTKIGIDLTREALETTERAFVFIDGFNVELTTAADHKPFELTGITERFSDMPHLFVTRFAVQPRWENGGNTPTRNMTIRIGWRGPEGPIPPEYIYRNPAVPFFLAPRATEPSEVFEMPGVAQALIDWSFNPIGDELLAFVWGRADYEDVFRHPHFVEWCYRVRFEAFDGTKLRAHFIQWGAHNRADEN